VLLSLSGHGAINAFCEFDGLDALLGEIKDVANERNASDGIYIVDMELIRSGIAAAEEDLKSS